MNEPQLRQWKLWDRWLTIIYNDITQIHDTRQVFEEVSKIVKNNSELKTMNSWFWRYFMSTYTDSLLIRIRRQSKIDDDKESISLARLLDQISKSIEIISREEFVLKYCEELQVTDKAKANNLFNKYARSSDKYISKNFIEKDIGKLIKITRKCVKCANRRVAHLDKTKLHFLPIEIEDIPSLEEINQCVEVLKMLLVKYYPLLRFGREIKFLHGDLGEGWKEIFKKAWIN